MSEPTEYEIVNGVRHAILTEEDFDAFGKVLEEGDFQQYDASNNRLTEDEFIELMGPVEGSDNKTAVNYPSPEISAKMQYPNKISG